MRYAQILDGRCHWIFEDDMTLEELYNSKFNRTQIQIIDITGLVDNIKEGYGYIDGVFINTDVKTLGELKEQKLTWVDSQVASHITGGFTSSATGVLAVYDSTIVDQENIKTMLMASQDPTFEADATYHGKIPIRAIRVGDVGKSILYHDATQMQMLVTDLAKHIGICKVRGWQLQDAISLATTEEELSSIIW